MKIFSSGHLETVLERIKSLVGAGVPTGGTTGQVLAKKTGTDYDTQWINPPAAGSGTPGPAGAAAGFGTPTATVDANVGTPSVTVTASGSDTAKVFSFSFKNLKGEKGATGATGATGAAGTRGSQIYYGTAVTGTSSTGTVFSSSGISSALVNDLYINTSTWNVYRCTTAGAASAAKWTYTGNIKGATGPQGPAGSGGSGGVGKSLAGLSVQPTADTTVTAREGAEIFNDLRARTYDSNGNVNVGNVAYGSYAHAEGWGCTAYGTNSHAEGFLSIAKGSNSHAEGDSCVASGISSHAEGIFCTASEDNSHAEGSHCTASGTNSHAEGSHCTASGTNSHAEGSHCTASGQGSHAGGGNSKAVGAYAYAHGNSCMANGTCSRAEGLNCTANGNYSQAKGLHCIASGDGQTAIGTANIESDAATDRLIVGKGTSPSARANCFRVTDTGVFATGNYSSTGADYAELFEWLDGNPDAEDRVGRFVTLDGKKIRLATPEDSFILGIISGNPSVIGDVHDDQWQGMYLYDIFGRPVWEDVEIPEETVEEPDPEDPEKTITRILRPAHMEHRQKLNPDYDDSQPYIPRSERPEWDCVGMLGKLIVLDGGTCQVNGWCRPGNGGIAVPSESPTKFRVLERLDGSHIRVLIL